MFSFARRTRRLRHSAGVIFPTIVGLTAFFVFMAFVEVNANGFPLVHRYFAGHWVSKVTTAMALVGLAALAANALNVVAQRRACLMFEPITGDSADDSEKANRLLDQCLQIPRSQQTHYRVSRFRAALRFIQRTGAADGLDDELKYQADVDTQRQSDNYAFVRILIWATPLLGFLGTVLGISQALGSIQLGPGNDFQQMMNSLRSNLYVAFDTTALALTLSIGLMFVQFVVVRFELDLLQQVDEEVRNELAHWFHVGGQEHDVYVKTMQRIGRSIVAATHEMSQKQIEVWRRSIETAQAAWLQSSQICYDLVQNNLSQTLDQSLQKMSSELSASIFRLDAALGERARQWQDNLVGVSEQIVERHRQSSLDNQQTAEILKQAGRFDDVSLKLRLADLVDSLNLLSSRLVRLVGPIDDASQRDAQPDSGGRHLRVVREDLAA